MKIVKLLSVAEMRWLIVSIIVIISLLAAVNVPFAITKMRSRTGAQPQMTLNLFGVDAAKQGWPSATPHDVQWPDPKQWVKYWEFGYRDYNVVAPSSDPELNGFSMQVQRLGWPFPAVEVKQMWWNWDDPALSGPEPDPRPLLVPLGVVLNPLVVGIPMWVVLCVFPVAIRVGIRLVRGWKGHCVQCGFDAGSNEICTECGNPHAPVQDSSSAEIAE